MRTWSVANGLIGFRTGHGSEVCGNCSREIPNGQPMQVIALRGVSRVRRRCEACAEGPVDWQQVDDARLKIEARASVETPQPPVVQFVQPATSFTKLRDVKVPFDPRMAAAGGDK